jgi:hypothetical protein
MRLLLKVGFLNGTTQDGQVGEQYVIGPRGRQCEKPRQSFMEGLSRSFASCPEVEVIHKPSGPAWDDLFSALKIGLVSRDSSPFSSFNTVESNPLNY